MIEEVSITGKRISSGDASTSTTIQSAPARN